MAPRSISERVGSEKYEDSRADLDTLQQLIHFLVRHLLSTLGENVSQLSSTNKPVSFLIEDLEPSDELLCRGKNAIGEQVANKWH